MEGIYHVYLFLCLVQMAVFIFTMSLGFHFKSNLLMRRMSIETPITMSLKINNSVLDDQYKNNDNIKDIINGNSTGNSYNTLKNYMIQNSEINRNNNNIINHYGDRMPDFSHYNNITFVYGKGFELYSPEVVFLDKEVCIYCLLSMIFGLLYINIYKLENIYPFLEKYADDVDTEKLPSDVIGIVECIRCTFWIFCFIQYIYFYSWFGTLFQAKFVSDVYLSSTMKTTAIWTSCRTISSSSKFKTKVLFAGIFLYICFCTGWVSYLLEVKLSLHLIIFLILQVSLDIILIFCHVWDDSCPMITILNCRLFYVAMSSSLIQITPFIII
jgi:hypothetical protein